jgi:hypothetical protein
MSKKILFAGLILALVVVVGGISFSRADTSVCSFISLLSTIGVITPAKLPAANAAFGCTTPVASVTSTACYQKCMQEKNSTVTECTNYCGTASTAPVVSPQVTGNTVTPSVTNLSSSGTYTCTSCKSAHSWYVDNKHMLWWDAKPYIPYGVFGKLDINNSYGITDFNIWLDNDTGNKNNDPVYLDTQTTQITNMGGTYIIQLLTMEPPNVDASKLADSATKKQIVDTWKKYKSAVSKDGLRGIVIWNEIDINFKWPTYTADQYGKILADYAKEAKAIFGDVPISFKTTESFVYTGVSSGVDAVVSGAVNANGLGFDSYATTCNASDFTSIKTALSKIESKQTKPTWFWIAEFGVGAEGRAKQCGNYWANFPPFASKNDMRCYMQNMIDNGVKGFIYAAPSPSYTNSCGDSFASSYTWYGELKSEMIQRIMSK